MTDLKKPPHLWGTDYVKKYCTSQEISNYLAVYLTQERKEQSDTDATFVYDALLAMVQKYPGSEVIAHCFAHQVLHHPPKESENVFGRSLSILEAILERFPDETLAREAVLNAMERYLLDLNIDQEPSRDLLFWVEKYPEFFADSEQGATIMAEIWGSMPEGRIDAVLQAITMQLESFHKTYPHNRRILAALKECQFVLEVYEQQRKLS